MSLKNSVMPGDVWEDEKGRQWVVTCVFTEPSVEMVPIEDFAIRNDRRKAGAIAAPIWTNFRRIPHRHPERPQNVDDPT